MTVYHYTSSNGVLGIINSSKLFCTNINFLNDPTELKYYKEVLKEVFKVTPECNKIYSLLYNQSYEQNVLNPFQNYIVSFSANNDSLSMWNYYANGNGYNIGFDIDSIIRRNRSEHLSIQKIVMCYIKSD